MSMKKQPARFSDQIRTGIETAPVSRYELSRRTGISQAVLSRFMHGKGGLSMDGLDRIAEELGLAVVITGAKKPTKGH